MEVIFSKKFSKKYAKLDRGIKDKFILRLDLFLNDPKNPVLNIHNLHGSYGGFFSLNVNADYRAIFRYQDSGNVEFVIIGTHSELYC